MKLLKHLRNIRVHPQKKGHQNETLYPPNIGKKHFHRSMKHVLVLAQCFGQMPVVGVSDDDVRSLQFKWKSWRMMYSVCCCLGLAFTAAMLLYKMIIAGADLLIISAFLFYIKMLISRLVFLQLAKNWPKLMKTWYSIELSMGSYGSSTKLDFRIKVITYVVMTTAAVQYTAEFVSRLVWASACKRTEQGLLEYYYTVISFPNTFSIIEYELWIGLILQMIYLLASFSWSFIDLFIMVVSSALALRFTQITERLRQMVKKKNSHEMVWEKLREDYNKLCKLCKTLDDDISYVILLSFASNLFFILIQLFNSLRIMKNYLERIYFFFSFAYLISRTVFVSLCSAWINDESKRQITILYSVSSRIYNLEIHRLIQQISSDTIALTGRHFFYITRGLVLSIAGAIVTYELVLIQFNGNFLKETILNGTAIVC